MTKKHVFIIIGVILCICIVATVIYLKVKYDEKEKQKSIYYKEQQSVLHSISSITLKNRTRSNLCISQV
ncbi:membrane protein [Staphylococcus aureus]|nr:membrane protein [Staphylococcus aureus]CPQ76830.1 membrane protein [Staphylococcus aureus]SRF00357.1 membrane protein [Staphylococcus aureus]SRF06090.1 membrane protein [Staphylococcus aureus]